MRLYHATSRDSVESIMAEGFQAGVYLTNSWKQARYYCETISDEGKSPVVIELELEDLLSAVDEKHIVPDGESISEPITSTLKISEDEVHEAWKASGRTWRDSLEIVASIRIEAPIRADILHCDSFSPQTTITPRI